MFAINGIKRCTKLAGKAAAALLLALLLSAQLAMPAFAAADLPGETGGEGAPVEQPVDEGPKADSGDEPAGPDLPTGPDAPGDPAEELDPVEDPDVPDAEDDPEDVVEVQAEERVPIGNFDELLQFATDWNAGVKYDGKQVMVRLTADIEGPNEDSSAAWDGRKWTPIGDTEQTAFTGVFDGAGHTINGLMIGNNYSGNNSDYEIASGIFGYIKGNYDGTSATEGVIKNLSVSKYYHDSRATRYKGVLAGHLEQAYITNVAILDKLDGYGINYIDNTIRYSTNMGALAGYAENSLIENSFAYAMVHYWASTQNDSMTAGGLVGLAESTDADIPMIVRDCYFVGQVGGSHGSGETASGATGGIVGKLNATAGSGDSGIFRCYTGAESLAVYDTYSSRNMSIIHGGSKGAAGGIVGEVAGGQVKNNVSMANGVFLRGVGQESIEETDNTITDVHRIAGKNTGGAIEGNYAFDGFTIRNYVKKLREGTTNSYDYIDGVVPLEADAVLDGTAVTGRQLRSGGLNGITEIWRATLGADAWYFANGKAPALKNMPAGAVQVGELPAYLVSQADIDTFSAAAVTINTEADLAELAAYVNSGSSSGGTTTGDRDMEGQAVTLAADIDLSAYPDWVPIGAAYQYATAFTGLFDGNGKTISGLSTGVASGSAGHTLNAYRMKRGLFGTIDTGMNDGLNGTEHTAVAGVHNLTLKDPQVCIPAGNASAYDAGAAYGGGSFAAGAIAGYVDDWNDYQTAIKNCAVISSYNGTTNTTGARVWAEGYANALGGLAGYLYGRGNSIGREENYLIENSYFVGEVDGGAHTHSVGGITGVLNRGAMIDNCFVAPDGTGRRIKGPQFAGGITGITQASQEHVIIKNCYVASDVQGGAKVGGLVGGIGTPGHVIRSSMVLGSVYGTGTDPETSQVGGLIGGWAGAEPSSYSSAGTSGCFVLSKEITSAAGYPTVGRVFGPDFASSSGGYAFEGTLVNGYTTVNSHRHGSSQAFSDLKRANTWDGRFTYTGYNSPKTEAADHWVMAENKLPILKNMPAGYTQSDAFPAHVKDVPLATDFTVEQNHYDFTLEKDLNNKTLYVRYLPSPATAVLPYLDVTTSNEAINFYSDYCGFYGFDEGDPNSATITVSGQFSGGKKTKTFTVAIDEQIPDVAGITIYSSFKAMAGRTYQLNPYVQPSRARMDGEVWSTSDATVATVDQNGLVTAVGAGTATITITLPAEKNNGTAVSKSSTATVVDYAAITSFAFTGAPAQIDSYDYASFFLDIAPEAVFLNSADVTFTAAPADMASVSGSYNTSTKRWNVSVSANKSDGNVTVTATATDKGKVWTDSVTIAIGTPATLTGLEIPKTYTLAKGASQALAVTPKPANAALPGGLALEIVSGSAKDLDGSAASGTIVSVSGTTVAAVNPGTVKVKVTGGGKTSNECTITVPAVLAEVAVSPASAALKIGVAPRQLEVVAVTPHAELPGDASITWRVVEEKDEDGATTTDVVTLGTGGKVTGLKLGTATIEASLTGSGVTGTLTARATVTVRDGITGVWFTEKGGGERIFSLLLDAEGAHDLSDYLNAQADDSVKVAFTAIKNVLDKDGKVLAKTPTAVTAAVTVTDSTDPENPETFTASLAVKLVTGLKTVNLSGAENRTIKVGKSATLKVAYEPANVSLKSVEWTSSNSAVATVDQAGKVVAVAPGKATVSAKVTPHAMSGTTAETSITRSYVITVPATAVEISHTANGGAPLAEAAPATGQTLALVPAAYVDNDTDDGSDKSAWVNFGALTLKAEALTVDALNAEDITWSSSDKNQKVVNLTAGGTGTAEVTAVATGTATLTATAANGAKATVKVKVSVPVRGITLAFRDAATAGPTDLLMGKSRTLVPTFNTGYDAEPAKADKALDWTILTGGEYITLSTGGVVKGVAPGVAKVQATSKVDDRRVVEYSVTVLAPATSAKLNQKNFVMPTGAERTLAATINSGGVHSATRPDDSTVYTIYEWTVDGGLTFKDTGAGTSTLAAPVLSSAGVAGGTRATVRLNVTSGGKALKAMAVQVTVDDSYTAVTSLSIIRDAKRPDVKVAFYAGESYTPKLTFNSGASNTNVIWTVRFGNGQETATNDYTETVHWSDLIAIDEATGKITALGGGMNLDLTVRATSEDDATKYDEYTFKIWQRATSVSIVRDNGFGGGFNPDLNDPIIGTITMEVGQTLRGYGYVQPNAAQFYTNNVKWAGNGAVVSLTDVNTGNAPAAAGTGYPVEIKALKAGTVTVSATAIDGSKKKASFKIKVVQQVNDIVITNTNGAQHSETIGGVPYTYAPVTVTGGRTVTLKAKLNAANDKNEATKKLVNAAVPTDKKVSWMVLGQWDEAGASVDGGIITMKNGKVTGLAKGTALVRVVPAGYAESYSKDNVRVYGAYNKKTGLFPEGLYGNTVLVTVNVPAAKVAIQQTKLTMRTGAGHAITLDALTTPEAGLLSAGEETVTWKADKEGVVQLVPVGAGHSVKVTGLAEGKVKLTATTASMKNSKTVEIIINDEAKLIQNFALVKDATWVLRGKSETLKVTVNAGLDAKKKAIAPGNANLRWSIEEYNWDDTPLAADKAGTVAVVDQKGKVTVKGDGYAIVKVEAVEDPINLYDTCTVYCQPKL